MKGVGAYKFVDQDSDIDVRLGQKPTTAVIVDVDYGFNLYLTRSAAENLRRKLGEILSSGPVEPAEVPDSVLAVRESRRLEAIALEAAGL